MRHLTAARRGDVEGWHYVSMSSRGGHPIGDCGNHALHTTEAEARACYRTWQREHVQLDVRLAHWADCRVDGCDNPTKTGARIDDGDGYDGAPLCDTHLTTVHAINALGLTDDEAGDAWVW
jgi:hypothetical protein